MTFLDVLRREQDLRRPVFGWSGPDSTDYLVSKARDVDAEFQQPRSEAWISADDLVDMHRLEELISWRVGLYFRLAVRAEIDNELTDERIAEIQKWVYRDDEDVMREAWQQVIACATREGNLPQYITRVNETMQNYLRDRLWLLDS